jgi:hypothetical protein
MKNVVAVVSKIVTAALSKMKDDRATMTVPSMTISSPGLVMAFWVKLAAASRRILADTEFVIESGVPVNGEPVPPPTLKWLDTITTIDSVSATLLDPATI